MMNLRKIIREEVNDFEWAKDTFLEIPCGDLKVGMDVFVTSNYDDIIGCDNQPGTVIDISVLGDVTVEFDVRFNNHLHDGSEGQCKRRTCWAFDCDYMNSEYDYGNYFKIVI